jgi:hypothetical protein
VLAVINFLTVATLASRVAKEVSHESGTTPPVEQIPASDSDAEKGLKNDSETNQQQIED